MKLRSSWLRLAQVGHLLDLLIASPHGLGVVWCALLLVIACHDVAYLGMESIGQCKVV